eukprot:MONOS_5046.1-p1 / transcript=MONOS_5046.1 / gene=MONOS_5046 / organism=Monocercomonoides_exilis_PA203 / gene_product=unspecified product / transcript_product=unspecified product / location=Mono_scaffold00142:92517-96957(-) / protein_length=1446 / sequence_SO=supercontig / SO=protein_coding / is_pseudo=false
MRSNRSRLSGMRGSFDDQLFSSDLFRSGSGDEFDSDDVSSMSEMGSLMFDDSLDVSDTNDDMTSPRYPLGVVRGTLVPIHPMKKSPRDSRWMPRSPLAMSFRKQSASLSISEGQKGLLPNDSLNNSMNNNFEGSMNLPRPIPKQPYFYNSMSDSDMSSLDGFDAWSTDTPNDENRLSLNGTFQPGSGDEQAEGKESALKRTHSAILKYHLHHKHHSRQDHRGRSDSRHTSVSEDSGKTEPSNTFAIPPGVDPIKFAEKIMKMGTKVKEMRLQQMRRRERMRRKREKMKKRRKKSKQSEERTGKEKEADGSDAKGDKSKKKKKDKEKEKESEEANTDNDFFKFEEEMSEMELFIARRIQRELFKSTKETSEKDRVKETVALHRLMMKRMKGSGSSKSKGSSNERKSPRRKADEKRERKKIQREAMKAAAKDRRRRRREELRVQREAEREAKRKAEEARQEHLHNLVSSFDLAVQEFLKMTQWTMAEVSAFFELGVSTGLLSNVQLVGPMSKVHQERLFGENTSLAPPSVLIGCYDIDGYLPLAQFVRLLNELGIERRSFAEHLYWVVVLSGIEMERISKVFGNEECNISSGNNTPVTSSVNQSSRQSSASSSPSSSRTSSPVSEAPHLNASGTLSTLNKSQTNISLSNPSINILKHPITNQLINRKLKQPLINYSLPPVSVADVMRYIDKNNSAWRDDSSSSSDEYEEEENIAVVNKPQVNTSGNEMNVPAASLLIPIMAKENASDDSLGGNSERTHLFSTPSSRFMYQSEIRKAQDLSDHSERQNFRKREREKEKEKERKEYEAVKSRVETDIGFPFVVSSMYLTLRRLLSVIAVLTFTARINSSTRSITHPLKSSLYSLRSSASKDKLEKSSNQRTLSSCATVSSFSKSNRGSPFASSQSRFRPLSRTTSMPSFRRSATNTTLAPATSLASLKSTASSIETTQHQDATATAVKFELFPEDFPDSLFVYLSDRILFRVFSLFSSSTVLQSACSPSLSPSALSSSTYALTSFISSLPQIAINGRCLFAHLCSLQPEILTEDLLSLTTSVIVECDRNSDSLLPFAELGRNGKGAPHRLLVLFNQLWSRGIKPKIVSQLSSEEIQISKENEDITETQGESQQLFAVDEAEHSNAEPPAMTPFHLRPKPKRKTTSNSNSRRSQSLPQSLLRPSSSASSLTSFSSHFGFSSSDLTSFRFDPNSDAFFGRWRLVDPLHCSVVVWRKRTSERGLFVACGEDLDSGKEVEICLLFDRQLWNETDAAVWWALNGRMFRRTWRREMWAERGISVDKPLPEPYCGYRGRYEFDEEGEEENRGIRVASSVSDVSERIEIEQEQEKARAEEAKRLKKEEEERKKKEAMMALIEKSEQDAQQNTQQTTSDIPQPTSSSSTHSRCAGSALVKALKKKNKAASKGIVHTVAPNMQPTQPKTSTLPSVTTNIQKKTIAFVEK